MSAFDYLLPQVKRTTRRPGVCRIGPDSRLALEADDVRLRRAVERIGRELKEPIGLSPPTGGQRSEARQTGDGGIEIRLGVNPRVVAPVEGYRLDIQPSQINIDGGSAAGCFWGLQTLRQLVRRSRGALPCAVIEDHPDLAVRGVLLDITRGRVPTVEMLKRLVDRLAGWKVNQLQLYNEHAFVFEFDVDISDADHGLMPDEVRELDDYARERFVTLVPALATFGHMGRVLSLPRYRSLSELEPTTSWKEMSWPQRARGFTLDCLNPEAHELVRRMWSEVLDAFSSPVVNICGDEPWDLGKGRHTSRLSEEALVEAYLDHIRRTYEICTARGRRCQAWSDVVRNHPQLLPRLPRDLTILHWGYDDKTDYDATEEFVRTGLVTIVCPGTSGWKRILPAIGVAERNIVTFAAAAAKHGAIGMVITDWGDHGHFQPPTCSLHGMAVGAACAWWAEHSIGAKRDASGVSFDERLEREFLGISYDANSSEASFVGTLREAARLADRYETWRLMWMTPDDLAKEAHLPTEEELAQTASASRMLYEQLERVWVCLPESSDVRHDLEELAVAARFSELFAEKITLLGGTERKTSIEPGMGRSRFWIGTGDPRHVAERGGEQLRKSDSSFREDAVRHGESKDAVESWRSGLRDALRAYQVCWRRRNKPSGLKDIETALNRVTDDMSAWETPR